MVSKGLEAVKDLREVKGFNDEEYNKRLDIIESELKDYENLQLKHKSMQDAVLDDFEKLKALEIIKKYYYYDKTLGLLHRGGIETQEEYDLLKEVLKDE